MKARAFALSTLALTISIPLATAYSGDITYYTPAAVASDSSCNIAAAPGESIVALSLANMNNGANPNSNPLCGTTISIYNPYNGQTVSGVKIVDSCQGCAEGSIDVNIELFEQLGFTQAQGRVQGVDWGGDAVGGKKVRRGLEPLRLGGRHPHGKGERL